MKKLIALVAAVGFAASAAVCFAADTKPAAPAAPAAPAKPAPANKPGAKVPEWTAKLVDGGDVKSGSLAGKPYAVVFVNSSCAACRAELEDLMNRDFGDKLKIYLGAVDTKPERTITTYRDSLKVTYPIIDDSKFALARAFGIGFTPASVIVDGAGNVEAWAAGFTEDTKGDTIAAFEKYLVKKK